MARAVMSVQRPYGPPPPDAKDCKFITALVTELLQKESRANMAQVKGTSLFVE
ncbi:uncharacterized protein EI90DRAFT_3140266 [Cantharellus anzutake]|uniref:uncharacterized protein n=1 Tax=Cantharellus anzutake TaxID=1750568 RepID=UPI0019061842|nr:uncharacterized protein EI90DRAFT_3140266 [Cantharellus anzutake]KAF8309775.1 hypothetical protein EI90DRAFT_3140266 [Cantharellus anzutake]